MTTSLENRSERRSSQIATLSRFPSNKVSASLLPIIHSTSNGVIIVDASKHIVLVNQKAEHLFGYPATQLLDQPLDLLIPQRTGTEQRRHDERLLLGRPNRRRSRLALKGLRSNGDELVLNTSISCLSVRGELYHALVVHSASANKSAPRRPERPVELRRRPASSQQANEIEKRRFSKKLYDDIGQRLSVLKLDLDWLENTLPGTNEAVPRRVAEMQNLLDNVISMTKTMASALRPPLLDDFGLLAAVEWLAENFQKKTGIACEVESAGIMEKFDDAIESAVYRVVQESLANVERHANATTASIFLKRSATHLDVLIRDDGIGISAGSENKPGCFGLIAMQERIFVLGGTISIHNIAPHGVTIQASIPVEPVFQQESPYNTAL